MYRVTIISFIVIHFDYDLNQVLEQHQQEQNFSNFYLNFDGRANDHGLLQELLVKFWRMVIHVQDSDEDFSQAVLALRVLGLDVEVVLGANFGVQAGPGLR